MAALYGSTQMATILLGILGLPLPLSGANSATDKLMIFFLFFQKTGFKCQNLFSGEKNKNFNMSSAENFTQNAIKLLNAFLQMLECLKFRFLYSIMFMVM